MYKTGSLLLLFFLSFAISFGQDKQLTKSLDGLFAGKFKQEEPGGEVLIARKGKIIYQKAFGSANLELNVRIQPGMTFEAGSITKQFTAVAILQLVEQGKLSLQDSLQKYVSDYPSKGHTITIENLLTHTSGIKDYMQLDYPEPYMERRDFRPKQLIDSFKTFALDFAPGSAFRYSNSGYFLLGYIIEKVSGKGYYRYIEDNLLKPLALTHTYFDTSNIIIPGKVNGYAREGAGFRKADFWSMTIAYAAGGLITNVEDLYKWHQGLYSYKIVKKETLEKAFMPYKLKDGITTTYGYGWFIKDMGDIHSIEHGGAISGFQANEAYYPGQDLFIAMLYNCDNTPTNELTIAISGMVLGKSLQVSVKVDEHILNDYVGTYALAQDTNQQIVIAREKNYLVAKIRGQDDFPLIFKSTTKFEFKNIIGVPCEFVKENEKVIKFTVNQNGLFEWKKIK
jgi:CubicO group peptidase (beta-lactamase class C family)